MWMYLQVFKILSLNIILIKSQFFSCHKLLLVKWHKKYVSSLFVHTGYKKESLGEYFLV